MPPRRRRFNRRPAKKRRFYRKQRGKVMNVLRRAVAVINAPKFLTANVILTSFANTGNFGNDAQGVLVSMTSQTTGLIGSFSWGLWPTPYTSDSAGVQGGMRSDRIFMKSMHWNMLLFKHLHDTPNIC